MENLKKLLPNKMKYDKIYMYCQNQQFERIQRNEIYKPY